MLRPSKRKRVVQKSPETKRCKPFSMAKVKGVLWVYDGLRFMDISNLPAFLKRYIVR